MAGPELKSEVESAPSIPLVSTENRIGRRWKQFVQSPYSKIRNWLEYLWRNRWKPSISIPSFLMLTILPTVICKLWITPEDSFYSIGQFWTGIVLIPVAIMGFHFARLEFVKSQAKPYLDLRIRNPHQELVNRISIKPRIYPKLRYFELDLEIINSGEANAELYTIEIYELGKLGRVGEKPSFEFKEEIGERTSDWRVDMRRNGCLAFQGTKKHSVPRNRETPFCRLMINLPSDNTERIFDIPYTIYVAGDKQEEESFLTVELTGVSD